MLDGIYQSVICFFMAYLLFYPAASATESGLGVDDRERMGVYVACAAIVVINLYILLNTYRWDWLIVLIVGISILLIWFWTGVYTSFTASAQFYKAATEVYGTLTFWTLTLLTVVICLLPRFSIKAFQKIYYPYDVDIIREQVRQGKFKYLDNYEAYVPPSVHTSARPSDMAKPNKTKPNAAIVISDDERPIYPPSEAATGTTYNPRSQNGSDGTVGTMSRRSMEQPPRPSFERTRPSVDRIRPSYEASNDFTSAALLTRLESSNSIPNSPHSRRRQDITSELQ